MKVEILEADVHYIHGTIAATAKRGFGVMLDPTSANTDGPSALIPATIAAGFQLERDVVGGTTVAEQNALLLASTAGDPDFTKPYLVGATVSARRVTRMEMEGDPDLILTSGTGAVSVATAANTALGYAAGRLRVKQSGDEIAFILRAQLTPQDPDNYSFRLLLERP